MFEKLHETMQAEIGPEVDIESVLERGEIESVRNLKGHEHFQVIVIKDDGKGLFKPDGEVVWNKQGEVLKEHRSELELLARRIDKILGFNLVPGTVLREVNSKGGTVQVLIPSGVDAVQFSDNWSEMANMNELRKAAVFDFLVDAQDRHRTNFILDRTTGKIWLIDHDYYMFFGDFRRPSIMIQEISRKNLTSLPENLIEAIKVLYDNIEDLKVNASDEAKIILAGVRTRAQALLEGKVIPT